MNKRCIDLLERALVAEIVGYPGLLQTRSKLAQKLESEGYLVKETIRLGGRFPEIIEGYRLTLLGQMTYVDALAKARGKGALT